MRTKGIQCTYCGRKAETDGSKDSGSASRERTLMQREHGPFRKYFYYRCPSCATITFVAPQNILGKKSITGLSLIEDQPDRTLNNLCLHMYNAIRPLERIFPVFIKNFAMKVTINRTSQRRHTDFSDDGLLRRKEFHTSKKAEDFAVSPIPGY